MNIEQWIAVWLFFALMCCVAAFAKKRNPFTWFAIGALTGAIGLVVVIVMPEGDLHQ